MKVTLQMEVTTCVTFMGSHCLFVYWTDYHHHLLDILFPHYVQHRLPTWIVLVPRGRLEKAYRVLIDRGAPRATENLEVAGVWSKIATKRMCAWFWPFIFEMLNICMSIKLLYTKFCCHVRKSEKLFGLGLFFCEHESKSCEYKVLWIQPISTTTESSLWTRIQVFGYE